MSIDWNYRRRMERRCSRAAIGLRAGTPRRAIPTGGGRAPVGFNHIPLAALINAVLDTGLVLTRVDEPREEDPPKTIGLRAEKP